MPSRILIADDHSALRMALRTTLERELNCVVCGEAANGQEAVILAAKCRPDLIVLDLGMPVLNGLQAARKILAEMPCVPVVLYTVYRLPELEQEARRAGVRRMIDKGAPVEILLNGLRSLLHEGRVRRNTAMMEAVPAMA